MITELLSGESLKCLEHGNDIVIAETDKGEVYEAPFIKSLHKATHINTLLGFEAGLLPYTKKIFAKAPYKKSCADYHNIVYHNTMKRLRKDVEGDFFRKLLFDGKG